MPIFLACDDRLIINTYCFRLPLRKLSKPDDLEARLSSLEAELEATKKKMKGYAGQIGVLKRERSTPEPTPSGHQPTSSAPEAKEAAPEEPQHPVHSYEKFCPDCAAPNPSFKDETECKNCHVHLGAAAQVEKLAACPFCGSTKGAKSLV